MIFNFGIGYFRTMKYDEHWSVLVENGQVARAEARRRKARPWVLSILTLGLLYHWFATGNRLRFYFSFSKKMKKLRIVYALSTRDSSRENTLAGFDFLMRYARKCGAAVIETVIVNPFIRTSSMLRHGWIYKGRSKYLWRIFQMEVL